MRRSFWAIALCSSCLDPTQITIEITTDLDCSNVGSTRIFVSTAAEIGASNTPTTSTAACVNGRIGSLVLVPSQSKDAVGVRVVTAPKMSSCEADGRGCIDARRTLRFVSHTPLRLPIRMSAVCAGVMCPAGQTCIQGACVDQNIADPTRCIADGCEEKNLAPDAGPPPMDAGPMTDANPMMDGGMCSFGVPNLVPLTVWHFDENMGTSTKDTLSLGPTSVPLNSWVQGPPGCGSAVHLKANQTVPLSNAMPFQSGTFAFSFWLKVDQPLAVGAVILGKGSSWQLKSNGGQDLTIAHSVGDFGTPMGLKIGQ
jgi:hypothetical protein